MAAISPTTPKPTRAQVAAAGSSTIRISAASGLCSGLSAGWLTNQPASRVRPSELAAAPSSSGRVAVFRGGWAAVGCGVRLVVVIMVTSGALLSGCLYARRGDAPRHHPFG